MRGEVALIWSSKDEEESSIQMDLGEEGSPGAGNNTGKGTKAGRKGAF
jgi:hypothetical protein